MGTMGLLNTFYHPKSPTSHGAQNDLCHLVYKELIFLIQIFFPGVFGVAKLGSAAIESPLVHLG